MKFLCLSLLLLFSWALSAEEALTPLKPGQALQRELRVSPSLESPVLRSLSDEDQIIVLRSYQDWYEVDVTTTQGLEFRGWVRGGLPKEKQKKPAIKSAVEIEAKKKTNPLRSTRYRWFWTGKAEETFSLLLGVGYQGINYDPSGVPDGSTDRVNIPGYNFGGFELDVDVDFVILETKFANRSFRWLWSTDYRWGNFQVRFASNFSAGEVAGSAYSIITQRLLYENRVDYRVLRFKGGFFRPSFGLGLFYFEVAPELRRTNQDNVIFTELQSFGMLTSLGFDLHFLEDYRVHLGGGTVLLQSLSETPKEGTETLESSGVPILVRGSFGYQLSDRWSTELRADYFQFSGKQAGASRRIDTNYTDLKFDFSSLSVSAGARVHF